MLKFILVSLPHVVLLLDIECQKNLFVNNSVLERLGYTAEEIHQLGDRVLQETLHPEDLNEIPELFERFRRMRDGDSFVHLNRWKTKSGEYRWFRNHVTPFKCNKDGQTTVVLGISRDITALIAAQEGIMNQIRNIEKVSFQLSHELRHEHGKILGIINLSESETDLNIGELKQISDCIAKSAMSIDHSIRKIDAQLTKIKGEFIRINSDVDSEGI